MSPVLKKIIKDELKLLKKLISLLENQYNLLTNVEKDIVEISKIAEQIDEEIKAIASLEIEKKNILQDKTLSTALDIVDGVKFSSPIKASPALRSATLFATIAWSPN